MKSLHIKLSDELYTHLVHVCNTQQLSLSALVRSTLAKHTGFAPVKNMEVSVDDLSLDDIVFDEE